MREETRPTIPHPGRPFGEARPTDPLIATVATKVTERTEAQLVALARLRGTSVSRLLRQAIAGLFYRDIRHR